MTKADFLAFVAGTSSLRPKASASDASSHVYVVRHPWSLPPDPRTPADFLYRAGQTFSIRRHVPRPPFGKQYSGAASRPRINRERDHPSASQTDWCLLYPPQESQAPPHPDTSAHTLHIVDEIACRHGNRAQVVRCRLDDEDAGESFFVAKIYDALYYRCDECDADVTYMADRDLSCETAVYEKLCQSGADGRFTPKFYGSWTFDVPVPSASTESTGPTSRPVRMILIEWIQGRSMYTLLDTKAIDAISPAQRLELVAEAMEGDSYLDWYNICHNDFMPRNVLVVNAVLHPDPNAKGKVKTQPSVYIIDFNQAYLMDSPYAKSRRKETSALPENPMYRFWNNTLEQFGSWIPRVYHQRKEVFNGWLKTRWQHAHGFGGPSKVSQFFNDFDSEVEYVPPESIAWPTEVSLDGQGDNRIGIWRRPG